VNSRTKVCAFCSANAPSLTKEHLWSDWIGRLYSGLEFSFRHFDPETSAVVQGKTRGFQNTVKAVCRDCNHGWMSDLETSCRPLLSDVIKDGTGKRFTPSDATKLAAFTFKNAVIANYGNPRREPFFTRAAREWFRTTNQIPPNVHMWIAALSTPEATGAFLGYVISDENAVRGALWHDGEIYIFTFSVGNLVLQLRAFRYGNLVNRAPEVPVSLIQNPFWDDFTVDNPITWPPLLIAYALV
jgi:hypothetical protein